MSAVACQAGPSGRPAGANVTQRQNDWEGTASRSKRAAYTVSSRVSCFYCSNWTETVEFGSIRLANVGVAPAKRGGHVKHERTMAIGGGDCGAPGREPGHHLQVDRPEGNAWPQGWAAVEVYGLRGG